MHYYTPPPSIFFLGKLFPDFGGDYSTYYPHPGSAMTACYSPSIDPPSLTLPGGGIYLTPLPVIPSVCPPPPSIFERGHSSSKRDIAMRLPHSFSPAFSSGRGWALAWPLPGPWSASPALLGLRGPGAPPLDPLAFSRGLPRARGAASALMGRRGVGLVAAVALQLPGQRRGPPAVGEPGLPRGLRGALPGRVLLGPFELRGENSPGFMLTRASSRGLSLAGS
jgi:hypothetical protein